MPFDPSPKVQELQARLNAFMDAHIYPNEKRHVEEAEKLGPWAVLPLIDELKPLAREQGLWNLFLPESEHGAGLTNLEARRRDRRTSEALRHPTPRLNPACQHTNPRSTTTSQPSPTPPTPQKPRKPALNAQVPSAEPRGASAAHSKRDVFAVRLGNLSVVGRRGRLSQRGLSVNFVLGSLWGGGPGLDSGHHRRCSMA